MSDTPVLNPDDRTERFVALLAQAEPRLHSYILTLVPHWSDADEVLQATNVTLWRKFSEFQPGTSFIAWARAVARIEVLRFRQRSGRDRLVFTDQLMDRLDQTLDTEADRLDAERQALSGCLRKLEQDDRDLVLRCYSGQQQLNSVAQQVGATGNALYKKLGRIRRALLHCIQRSLDAEGGR